MCRSIYYTCEAAGNLVPTCKIQHRAISTNYENCDVMFLQQIALYKLTTRQIIYFSSMEELCFCIEFSLGYCFRFRSDSTDGDAIVEGYKSLRIHKKH